MLTTTRLTIMPLRPEQLDMLLHDSTQASSSLDFEVAEWLMDSHLKMHLEKRLNHLKEDPEHWLFITPWLLIHKTLRQIVGKISFNGPPDENGYAEVTYCMHLPYYNQGYMTEALSAFVNHTFKELDVKGIIASTLVNNLPSHRLLLNLGFHKVFTNEINIIWRLEKTGMDG